MLPEILLAAAVLYTPSYESVKLCTMLTQLPAKACEGAFKQVHEVLGNTAKRDEAILLCAVVQGSDELAENVIKCDAYFKDGKNVNTKSM